MVSELHIGDRPIGTGHPCLVIAEAGVNHNCRVDLALKLVDAALVAGADAIKFQTFIPERLVAKGARKAAYQEASSSGDSQLEMLKTLWLPFSEQMRVAEYCKELGVMFLSTPFDEESARCLFDLGVPAFKVASPDITNFPLLRKLAAYGRPLIVSTGMATIDEVDAAMADLTGHGASQVALLQCTSMYPAPAASVNLRAMTTLGQRFGVPVGLSDHTDGIEVAIAATALGACIIEKHLTLDRTMHGPDHAASLSPNEFSRMVESIRNVESALGDGIKAPHPDELAVRAVVRRGLVAARNIEAGSKIEAGMLIAMRPEEGICPAQIDQVVGKTAVCEICEGTPLAWEHIG